MTPRRDRADERRAMHVFAFARGIPFAIVPSHFMPGALCYVVGEGPARRVVHSPARAWSALRAAAAPRPARKVPASLRGAVMDIRVVK